MVPRMLGMATKVVSDYGKVLAQVEPGVYGLPESLLPHNRESIRFAILTLLRQLGSEHPEVKEGLRQGYVYLAQFVGDEEANRTARGDDPRVPHQFGRAARGTGAGAVPRRADGGAGLFGAALHAPGAQAR